LFGVIAIIWIAGGASAHSEYVCLANLPAYHPDKVVDLSNPLGQGIRADFRYEQHKLVATNARSIVPIPASLAHCLGCELEHSVADEVSESIVDLFEPIHIQDQHGQARPRLPRERQAFVQFEKERPCIR
jgi:Mn-dependent DtxR family transcriptional regulator